MLEDPVIDYESVGYEPLSSDGQLRKLTENSHPLFPSGDCAFREALRCSALYSGNNLINDNYTLDSKLQFYDPAHMATTGAWPRTDVVFSIALSVQDPPCWSWYKWMESLAGRGSRGQFELGRRIHHPGTTLHPLVACAPIMGRRTATLALSNPAHNGCAQRRSERDHPDFFLGAPGQTVGLRSFPRVASRGGPSGWNPRMDLRHRRRLRDGPLTSLERIHLLEPHVPGLHRGAHFLEDTWERAGVPCHFGGTSMWRWRKSATAPGHGQLLTGCQPGPTHKTLTYLVGMPACPRCGFGDVGDFPTPADASGTRISPGSVDGYRAGDPARSTGERHPAFPDHHRFLPLQPCLPTSEVVRHQPDRQPRLQFLQL